MYIYMYMQQYAHVGNGWQTTSAAKCVEMSPDEKCMESTGYWCELIGGSLSSCRRAWTPKAAMASHSRSQVAIANRKPYLCFPN